jgi:hypothetical protein
MKRILLVMAAAGAMTLGGLLTTTAQAHGPYGYRCGHGPRYIGYGPAGYYGPTNVYYPRAFAAPYAAGYSGGWQPYPGVIYSQPRFGLYVGF